MKIYSQLFLFCFLFNCAFSQSILNGDLNGTIVGFANMPPNWQQVPFTDPACGASAWTWATADLTSTTMPFPAIGLIGNPYSGSTFVSGLSINQGTNIFHEGIMQSVSGFVVGDTYTVSFHQAVVKQQIAVDTSGAWSVYLDGTIVSTTAPSISHAVYNSTSFNWDARSATFIATSTSHTLKFLPKDDDADQDTSSTNLAGGLRMGIDSIYMENVCNHSQPVYLGADTIICASDSLQLSAGNYSSYLWSPASAISCTTCANPLASTTTGVQINVEVWDSNGCQSADSMQIEIYNFSVELGPDTVICDGETIVLNAMNPGKTYIWQDSSTNPTFAATTAGTYWVTVTSALGCTITDTIDITTCVALTPLQNEMEIQWYPNPFTDRLNINNPMVGEINIEILDQLGRIVLRQYGNHEQFSVDVSTIPSGIYFCRIIMKHNETFIQKLVKH